MPVRQPAMPGPEARIAGALYFPRDRRKAVFLFLHVTSQMSAIGTKRTLPCALHMSAFDPKRTLLVVLLMSGFGKEIGK
jgi:hypothetical protein